MAIRIAPMAVSIVSNESVSWGGDSLQIFGCRCSGSTGIIVLLYNSLNHLKSGVDSPQQGPKCIKDPSRICHISLSF